MFAMSTTALVATLLCAIGFAAFDYFRKVAAQKFDTRVLLVFLLGGQVPVISTWLLTSGQFQLDAGYFLPGVVTALAGLAANILFLMALQISPLSLMIPLLSFVPVLTTLFSALLLKEVPTLQQLVGIMLTVAGVCLLYSPPDSNFDIARMWRNLRKEAGAKYMAIVALLWSLTGPLDKICLSHASTPVHALIQVSTLFIIITLWVATTKRLTAVRLKWSDVPILVAAIASGGIAYGSQLIAYQLTLVGVVETLKRSVGLISSVLLGRLLLDEPLSSSKIVGILSMAAGVSMIVLPDLF